MNTGGGGSSNNPTLFTSANPTIKINKDLYTMPVNYPTDNSQMTSTKKVKNLIFGG
jgi:hypothetical protein